jgi:hypothetical protein
MYSLAVFSWYLSDSFGLLLREDLRDRINLLSKLEEREFLLCLLSSKKSMLVSLGTFSMRDVYGNWIRNVENVAKRLHFFTKEPQRAKRKVRRRGYRDHGSCRPETLWLPKSDWRLTQIQNQLEQERDFFTKVTHSISRFGVLGVRLPEFERT